MTLAEQLHRSASHSKDRPDPACPVCNPAGLAEVADNQCPACSNRKGNRPRRSHPGVYDCAACRAVFGTIRLGESYAIVLPQMTGADVPPERQRYFDFMTWGSQGTRRRHGWFDPDTKMITQVG